MSEEIPGQVKATAHYPDGSPVPEVGHWTPAGGRPPAVGEGFARWGRTEEAAARRAKLGFTHHRHGRPGCHDLTGADLVGATIRIAGQIVERYCKRIVTDAAGKVVDVVYEWLDVREEELAKKRAAEIAAAQAEVDGMLPKPAKRGKE